MTDAFYLVGPPAVGKTTLMDSLLAGYHRGQPVRLDYGPMIAEPLYHRGGEIRPEVRPADGLHLGKTRLEFGGTDALGMVVLHDAVRWAREAPLPALIAGEGARLTHPLFLGALATRSNLVVLYLQASTEILDARVADRGSEQKVPWRNGQATRVRNAARNTDEIGVRVIRLDARKPAEQVAERARTALGAYGILLP